MNKEKLTEILKKGSLDSKLREIYGADFEKQKDRYLNLANQFEIRTGKKDFSIFSTSGRTELMGNHTDHNHGCVLAASIQLDTLACAAKRDDTVVEIISEGYPPAIIDLEDLTADPAEKGTTQALIRGIASRFKQLGHQIGGYTAITTSGVPGGSGLSSSAAVEILIGTVFNFFYNSGLIDPVELAKIGQYSENNYFGKPCGLMDQIACAYGGIVKIDFKDPANPIVEKVDVHFQKEGYTLMVIDTAGSHADLTDEYAAVPAEMKAVAALFGHEVLRECSKKEIMDHANLIRKEVGDRAFLRALHFIDENERPEAAVAALQAGDMQRYLRIVNESGRSSWCYLQNCTCIKDVFHQGVTTALALANEIMGDEGVFRVHGGGFAGTIQCYIPNAKVDFFKEKMEHFFGKGSVTLLRIRPVSTTRVIE